MTNDSEEFILKIKRRTLASLTFTALIGSLLSHRSADMRVLRRGWELLDGMERLKLLKTLAKYKDTWHEIYVLLKNKYDGDEEDIADFLADIDLLTFIRRKELLDLIAEY